MQPSRVITPCYLPEKSETTYRRPQVAICIVVIVYGLDLRKRLGSVTFPHSKHCPGAQPGFQTMAKRSITQYVKNRFPSVPIHIILRGCFRNQDSHAIGHEETRGRYLIIISSLIDLRLEPRALEFSLAGIEAMSMHEPPGEARFGCSGESFVRDLDA